MSVLEKIANMEQNMDGENNHRPGEWEKHEIDRELLEQLDHLFDTNKLLFGAERHKAHSQRLISNLPERVRPSTLECTMHNCDTRCLIARSINYSVLQCS